MRPAWREARPPPAAAACSRGAASVVTLHALALPRAAEAAMCAQLRLCRPQARIVWEALLFLAARVRLRSTPCP